jgi:hypothetical protein
MLSCADRLRVEQLCDDVWGDVFPLLDSVDNLTGDAAGKCAQQCCNAVRTFLSKAWDDGYVLAADYEPNTLSEGVT